MKSTEQSSYYERRIDREERRRALVDKVENTSKDSTEGMKYKEGYISKYKVPLAATAAILAVGAIGYKRGMYRGTVDKAIKFASKNYKNKRGTFNAVREWVSSGELMKKGLKSTNGSFFRPLPKDTQFVAKDFLSLLKAGTRREVLEKAQKRYYQTFSKGRLSATKNDLHNLKRIIATKNDEAGSLLDSSFFKRLGEIDTASQSLEFNDGLGKDILNSAKSKMTLDLLKISKTTKEAQEELLNKTNHRFMTMEDIFNVDTIKDSSGAVHQTLYLKEDAAKNLGVDKEALERIRGRLSSKKNFFIDVDGKPKSIAEHKDFKSIVVDPGLLVSKEGKLTDIRMFKNLSSDIAHSLAYDFKIPVVGINPFRIFGLGDIGKEKTVFAAINKATVQPTLTGATGKEAIGKSAFFSNGSIYSIDESTRSIDKIAENMTVNKIGLKDEVLGRTLEAQRKMANIDKMNYAEREGENIFTGIARALDLGYDDATLEDMSMLGIGDALNANTYIAKIANKMRSSGTLMPHKGIELDKQGNIVKANMHDLFAVEATAGDIFVAINKQYGIKNAVNDFNEEGINVVKKYFKQFTAGRKNLNEVSEGSAYAHFLVDRVSTQLSSVNLGFSTESKGSSVDIIKNLMLKRYLPLQTAWFVGQYAVHLSEGEEDENGERDNILKKAARLVSSADLGFRKFSDSIGLSEIARGFAEAMPGIDNLTELPLISSMKLGQNYEERIEWYKSGMDPIRKGRFWDSGLTAYTGGKIEAYRPNLYRRIQADVEFSDSKYGSRAEYFANAAIPTPTNPLAPIRHFITDRYHYDEKHKWDRPYLTTEPMFQNVPFIGGALSSTIGEIIKPSKSLHEDYFDKNGFVQGGFSYFSDTAIKFVSKEDGSFTEGMVSTGGLPSGGIGNGEELMVALPMIQVNKSGVVDITNISTGEKYSDLREQYKAGTPSSRFKSKPNYVGTEANTRNITEAEQVYKEAFEDSEGEEYNGYENTEYETTGSGTSLIKKRQNQNSIFYNTRQFFEDSENFLGLYGFVASAITGDAMGNKSYIENASYAYSPSRGFWNQSVGGIGGNANEIARRFLRKRLPDSRLVNPVRNTMPDWMPGEDYMKDLKHGDAMVKVPFGEERLPGEGYERLWGINDYKLYSVEAEETFEKGRAIKNILEEKRKEKSNYIEEKKVISDWKDNVDMIETDIKVDDKKHFIKATADGLFQNADGTTSVLIVKSTKEINGITEEDREKDKANANFLMYSLEAKSAVVQYVDHSGTGKKVYNYNYDEDTVRKSFKNTSSAIDVVKNNVDRGIINKGDLYSSVDKFRILSDVAPYSKEFDRMNQHMREIDLTDEERKDVTEARKRSANARKPLRTYEYMYKNAGTKSELVIIDSLMDRGVFKAKGINTPFKLAGIRLKSPEDEEEKEKMEDFLNSKLGSGNIVSVEYSKDNSTRIKGSTGRAIVKSDGVNINKELVRLGYASYDDADDSLSNKVKTNEFQRAFGRVWEGFAHMDTPFHSKFLRVRSAAEDYERSRVYGKTFGLWENFYSDYFKPFVFDRNVGRGVVSGLFWGTMVGKMFGDTKFGRLVGGAVGFTTILGGKMYAKGYEIKNGGEKWRPERVRTHHEIEDYVDKLKFVKYRSLYNDYVDRAKIEDGVDVKKYMKKAKKTEYKNKKRKANIEKHKVKAESKKKKGKSYASSDATYNLTGFYLGVESKLKVFTDTIKGEFDYLKSVEKYKQQTIGMDLSNLDNVNVERPQYEDRKKSRAKLAEATDKAMHKSFMISLEDKMNKEKEFDPLMGMKGKIYNRIFGDKKLMSLFDLRELVEASEEGILLEELREALDKEKINYSYTGKGDRRKLDKAKILLEIDKRVDILAKANGYSANALKAMTYYRASEKTMYAFDKGKSIVDLTTAMNKQERDYFKSLVKMSEGEGSGFGAQKEKLKMLDLAPKYMRRGLEAAWGIEVEKRDNLESYFDKKGLPGQSWKGWNEDVDLNDVKVKMIKKANLSFSDTNIWDDDVRKANEAGNVPIPTMKNNQDPEFTKRALKSLFKETGLSDLNTFSRRSSMSNDVNLYMRKDERTHYEGVLDKAMSERIR